MLEKLFDIPTVSFCEKITNGFIKRPWYALSNVGYLLVGLLILRKGGKSVLGSLLGYSTLLVGLLSFVYDATYIRLTQLFDITGMLIFILVLIFIAQSSISRFSLRRYLFFSIPLLLFLIITTYFMGAQSGNIISGLLIVLFISLEYYCYKKNLHHGYKYLLTGSLLLITGFSIWLLDTTKTVCFGFGLLNGRSIFHFLTAIAIYQVYEFYSSQ
jgi:hypothetical protein